MKEDKSILDFRGSFHQIWSASRLWLLILFVLSVAPLAAMVIPVKYSDTLKLFDYSWYQFLFATVLMFFFVSVCKALTNVFSLRKNENGITCCQITILITIVIWIISFIVIFKVGKNSQNMLVFGIVTSVISWIFQDIIRGIASFIHLRLNHLLCIGDWIQVPRFNVYGQVIHITLTTVTIYNKDTTTSSIPTSVLQADHFINLQRMLDGKTYGRLLDKTFYLAANSFHPLSSEETERLKQRVEVLQYLPEEEIQEGVLNGKLFRLYLYHWLMNHPFVSQQPRLVVRWMEQRGPGIPLQINAYIMEGELTACEWQQSQIIEHIIESSDWFNLRIG